MTTASAPLTSLDNTLIISLIELGAQLHRTGYQLIQKEGLTTQQWLVLLYIQGDPSVPFLAKRANKGPMLASDIADALHVSRPNITNLINSLITKGFVLQSRDEEDKRRKKLELTNMANDCLERLNPLLQELNGTLFSAMSNGERNDFLKYIQSCLQIIGNN